MSSRTIDSSGHDETRPAKTTDQKRIERLEMSLRVIRTWAACWTMAFESPEKAMTDIQRKCDEVLQ